MSDLDEPNKVTHAPGGHFIAADGEEHVGDVSDVVFCNGVIARDNDEIYVYYASSDTRIHVATTTIDQMLDYVLNTPEDPLRSYACVQQRIALIDRTLAL